MFEDDFVRAMQRREKQGPIAIALTPSALLAVIGNVQLALRHPGNTGPTAALLRDQILPQLIDALASGNPVLRRGAEMGNDPARDVTSDPRRN